MRNWTEREPRASTYRRESTYDRVGVFDEFLVRDAGSLTFSEQCFDELFQFVGFDVTRTVSIELFPDLHEIDARLERIILAEEEKKVLFRR